MRSASLGRVAGTISLLFSVALGTAQPVSSGSAPMLGQSTAASVNTTGQSLAMGEGRIHLDVVVRDASGNLVTGLQAQDFSLSDDGKPRKIVSFTAFDEVKAKPAPPVVVILMIDALNNDFIEMAYIRQGLEQYLRQNAGHLAQPTSIVRLTTSGMETLSQASLDGNALADVVRGMGASNRPNGIYTFPPSMNALKRLAEEEAAKPGRKLLIWLGEGWPTPSITRETFTAVDGREQRANYQLIVQISKSLLDGHIVLYGGYTASEFYMRDYLKEVRKASDLDPHALSLDVLAYKSGGRGEVSLINGDSAVAGMISHFVAEASAYYAISFNPLQAKKADEFHALSVAVDRAGVTARTASGYYDQPEYYRPETMPELTKSLRKPEREALVEFTPVTVAQLSEIIREEKNRRDAELAKELERLQLTQRLNTNNLSALTAELRGPKAKAALMAVGDASVFLEPPEAEIPDRAVPDMEGRRRIFSLTVDYLKTTIPKLPNFYAKRFTTSFEEVLTPKSEKETQERGALHRVGESKATVYYRGGKEVVDEHGKQEHGLITRGTFGPILNTVIGDAARSSSMQWGRWEDGPNGPMAVFRFQVPQTKSHYEISSAATMPLGGNLVRWLRLRITARLESTRVQERSCGWCWRPIPISVHPWSGPTSWWSTDRS